MNILREIATGYTRYAELTGRLPTLLVLNTRDAARFDAWLRVAIGDRCITLLNRDRVLGMRVVRVVLQDGMLFLEEDQTDGREIRAPGAPGARDAPPPPPCCGL